MVPGQETNLLGPLPTHAWGQVGLGAPSRVEPSTDAVAFAATLGAIVSQNLSAGRSAQAQPPPLVAAKRQQALAKLRVRAGTDVKAVFRPGNGTAMQIRGRALEPAARGMALSLATSVEHLTALNFLAANRALLGLDDPASELRLVTQENDGLGQHHLRFTQRYQNLPVWPASLSVHTDRQGNVTLLEGAYIPTPAGVATHPAVPEADAARRARWSVPGGAGGQVKEVTLLIYAPLDQPPSLAWRLVLTVDLAHVWAIVVDAQDGRVVNRINQCLEANVQASAKDLGGQMRTFNVWSANGGFSMADTSKSMFDAAHDPIKDPKGVISIFDAREVNENDLKTVYLVDSTSLTTWLPDAVSAMVNFETTFDYYQKAHQRNSLDGNGGNVQAAVRIAQLDNAFWNGDAKMMFFGNVKPYPLALDVVGHELTHGVTQNTADLIYELQPGAANEAFSDIFGEMVEASAQNGQPDWLLGEDLGDPFRDFKNPGSIKFGNRPLPSKMSEYIDLPNDNNNDHGGVHINSSIINHAYYMLAAGLPDAVGIPTAEKIFYRCLTQHLQKQSQFIDVRLACVSSAEELFGAGSAQAKATGEAFDAVEIFETPPTPEPSPIPVVQGPDSTLFIGYDPFFGAIALGRYEAAQNDPADGIPLVESVQPARPAVSGDGSFALFVDSAYDLCGVATDDPNTLACTGYRGFVHSVAVSPNSRLYAFVLRNPLTGQAINQISIYDYVTTNVQTFNLVAPVTDSTPVDNVLYADSMTFTADSKQLIYDALTEIKFGTGATVQRWSIYRLDIATGSTTVLVPAREGGNFGNPAIGRASNRYLAFDTLSTTTGLNTIMVIDLFTGNVGAVGSAGTGLGYPCFTGDESAVVYATPDPTATYFGFSLVKQPLSDDRLSPNGPRTLWMYDSPVGVVYRRGSFTASNSLPAVVLSSPVDGATFALPATITLAATASDVDGTVAKVEFYSGSDKTGESLSPPYTYTWTGVPAGAYRLTARAIDNLGGSTDSEAAAVTVGAVGAGAKLSAVLNADHVLTVTIQGPAGNYTLQQSTDLIQWADNMPVVITVSGSAAVNPAGGVPDNRDMFYRVRTN